MNLQTTDDSQLNNSNNPQRSSLARNKQIKTVQLEYQYSLDSKSENSHLNMLPDLS